MNNGLDYILDNYHNLIGEKSIEFNNNISIRIQLKELLSETKQIKLTKCTTKDECIKILGANTNNNNTSNIWLFPCKVVPIKFNTSIEYLKNKEQEFVQKQIEYNQSINNCKRYYADVKSKTQIHRLEPELQKLNLIHFDENKSDYGIEYCRNLQHLDPIHTNFFFGTKYTGVGFHLDAYGAIGTIYPNTIGKKLFLLVDFHEVQLYQLKHNINIFTSYTDNQTNKQRMRISYEFLIQSKSFRWVILESEQIILWSGVMYHSIINIENSLFISSPFEPMNKKNSLSFLKYIIEGEPIHNYLKSAEQLEMFQKFITDNIKQNQLDSNKFKGLLENLNGIIIQQQDYYNEDKEMELDYNNNRKRRVTNKNKRRKQFV